MKASILFLFSILAGFSYAENDSIFVVRENQLVQHLNNLRKASSDLEKETANQQFKSYLLETIKIKGAADYPFAKLRSMGSIKSPDNSFRLFNWNVEQEDETHKYYCYILRFDERKKDWKVIELTDNSMMLPPQPEDVLDENMWYGALYYKIIPFERSGKTVYILLGLDENNNMSHTKLIDVLSFSGSHVKLGSPIFKIGDQTHKRLFFEHSKKCVMSLNYDASINKIVFDHLSPESPSMEGFREFYVPDMTYDALKVEGNKWILENDVIRINTKDPKPLSYRHLDEKGRMVETNVKQKTWIDPSNPNAPAGANIHTATMPTEENEVVLKKDTKPQSDLPSVKKNKKQKSAIGGFCAEKKALIPDQKTFFHCFSEIS